MMRRRRSSARRALALAIGARGGAAAQHAGGVVEHARANHPLSSLSSTARSLRRHNTLPHTSSRSYLSQPFNNPPNGLGQARTTLRARTPRTTSRREQDIPPEGYSAATSIPRPQDRCRGLGPRSERVRTRAGTRLRRPIGRRRATPNRTGTRVERTGRRDRYIR
jgi:hypothetical protein